MIFCKLLKLENKIPVKWNKWRELEMYHLLIFYFFENYTLVD